MGFDNLTSYATLYQQLTASTVSEPSDCPDRMEIEAASTPQHHGMSTESLEAISAAIDRGIHLGIAIRQSSVRRQANKARADQQAFDLSSFEGFAYLALKTLYADASEELVERLTQSMTETYALFLSRKSRHEALQAPQGLREQPRTPLPLSNIAEEPDQAGDTLAESSIDADTPATSREGGKSGAWPSRRPPPVEQHRLLMESERPPSVDTQEVMKKYTKMLTPVGGKGQVDPSQRCGLLAASRGKSHVPVVF